MSGETQTKQLLHLVLGGELARIDDVEFKDLDKVEFVGLFPNYATAYTAWRAKAQQTYTGIGSRQTLRTSTA